MAFYESVIIARQDASVPQVETLQDSLATLLEEQGGKVTKREYWGLRSLAYRVKKNRKGHYVLFNIDAPGTAVKELDRQLRLNEDVLRHMIVRVDELDEGESIMMQKGGRDDRDSRPRRDDRGDRGDRGGRPQRDDAPRRAPRNEGSDIEAEGDKK